MTLLKTVLRTGDSVDKENNAEPVSRLDEIIGSSGKPIEARPAEIKSILSEIIGDAPKTNYVEPQRNNGFLSAEGYSGEGAASGAGLGLLYGLANKFLFPAELIEAQTNLQKAKSSLEFFRDLQGAPADVIASLQKDVQKYSKDVGDISRKIPGASGAENYARVMAGQKLPDVVSARVEDMTKANPRGTSAYQVAERDAQALAKIRAMGEGSQRLVGSGTGQLMLPAAEAARIEQEAAAKAQAALKNSQGTIANRLRQFGLNIARSPVIAGTLSGAGTGLSFYDAINSAQKDDTANAISSGIEAGFGALSMYPHPLAKAVGAVGGLTAAGGKALVDYLGEKYSFGIPSEIERTVRLTPPRRQ